MDCCGINTAGRMADRQRSGEDSPGGDRDAEEKVCRTHGRLAGTLDLKHPHGPFAAGNRQCIVQSFSGALPVPSAHCDRNTLIRSMRPAAVFSNQAPGNGLRPRM